jgi:Rps23 Pro-64 3,4-dihydroxylase Tpa1-like proline 4-hydroxylase
VIKIINDRDWGALTDQFLTAKPFNYVVIDDFFVPEVADQLVKEFPAYDSSVWNAHYQNAMEDKKACNHWDKFPQQTYAAFHQLCGYAFENIVERITGNVGLQADIGLHGGGWHSHTKNGKLNVHLDYSIHPKLKLERHYNLIVYITPNWQPEWGGGLELWSHDSETNTAKECVTRVENRFNRAVLFDTTQNSWHGLPGNLSCPEGIMRQSMAVYYVTDPKADANPRGKALFVPYGDQKNDPAVLELIKQRSDTSTAHIFYKK